MISAELRAWRRQHKLTQAQAATCLGVSPITVSQYERGVRAIPQPVALLCGAYEHFFGMGFSAERARAEMEIKSE